MTTAERTKAFAMDANGKGSAVELIDDEVRIHDMTLKGVIADLAQARVLIGELNLERLVRDAVDIGGAVLLHGQSRAAVEAVAGEIDRLIGTAISATEELPSALQESLNEHLASLTTILAERFDANRTGSVQSEISAMVKGTTSDQVRALVREVLAEDGPLNAMNERVVAQLKLVNGANQDTLAKVTTLAERIDTRLALHAAAERSSQKGLPFEEVVRAELEAIHATLGDDVRHVAHEYGANPRSQAGDFVILVNPRESGGREVRLVVEAKTGRLSGRQAQDVLEHCLSNREAAAAVLVFDSTSDAPLGGRRYCPYVGGKFVAVLDGDDLNPLALEVACHSARALALASVVDRSRLDSGWLIDQCDHVSEVIEKAREIKQGASAVRRGLAKIEGAYEDLRRDALGALDSIRSKATEG